MIACSTCAYRGQDPPCACARLLQGDPLYGETCGLAVEIWRLRNSARRDCHCPEVPMHVMFPDHPVNQLEFDYTAETQHELPLRAADYKEHHYER